MLIMNDFQYLPIFNRIKNTIKIIKSVVLQIQFVSKNKMTLCFS
jgi:hypothetical protein